MEANDLVGIFAGLLTTGAQVPQVITTYKKRSAEGLSFRMLLALVAGLSAWVVFGVMQHSLPIIVFNVIAVALVVALLAMKFKFDRKPTKG